MWRSEVKVTQSCPTLCDPVAYTVHGILQARTLEWVAYPFSRGSSQPRDRTGVSCIAGRFFTNWAIREARQWKKLSINCNWPRQCNLRLQPCLLEMLNRSQYRVATGAMTLAIFLVIHSKKKCILSTCSVTGSFLDTGDLKVSKKKYPNGER